MLPLPGECGCGYVKYEMALGALHIDVFSLLPASSHGLTSHIRIRVPLECTFSYREADGGSRCETGTFSACATASCWNQPNRLIRQENTEKPPTPSKDFGYACTCTRVLDLLKRCKPRTAVVGVCTLSSTPPAADCKYPKFTQCDSASPKKNL